MRLSPQQREIIRHTALEIAGDDARVWLFGSRTNDQSIGGDIDLLIESTKRLPLQQKIKLQARLEMTLHMPVDVLTHTRNTPTTPIVNIAQATGIRLI